MYYIFCVISIVLGANLVYGHSEDAHTIQYNAETFSEEVPKKNHFVMFYAPWCGHCQRLAPTWEQLAEMLNEDDSNIRIAKVDCTVDSKVCSDQDVTGYPTLKFFRAGTTDIVKFRGTRDLPSLTTFINEQLRSVEEEEETFDRIPEPVNGLTELTDDTFGKFTIIGKHFVKFYAPWCGHCQKLAPVWEQLAESLEFEPAVRISKLDCTQHRTVCNQLDIKGYPTLMWIENGKKIDKYQGQRAYEDLKEYINKMLGMRIGEEDVVEKKPADTVSGGAVIVLNGDNFYQGVEKGIAFVKFFAPWCGHCKRLALTWEELAKKFTGNSEVNIVKVDCTLEENKQLCNEQEVDGFPSIYLYKNGKKISEYNGDRSLDDLEDFVKKHFGSHDEL